LAENSPTLFSDMAARDTPTRLPTIHNVHPTCMVCRINRRSFSTFVKSLLTEASWDDEIASVVPTSRKQHWRRTNRFAKRYAEAVCIFAA
jgi:hypothetical protein